MKNDASGGGGGGQMLTDGSVFEEIFQVILAIK